MFPLLSMETKVNIYHLAYSKIRVECVCVCVGGGGGGGGGGEMSCNDTPLKQKMYGGDLHSPLPQLEGARDQFLFHVECL